MSIMMGTFIYGGIALVIIYLLIGLIIGIILNISAGEENNFKRLLKFSFSWGWFLIVKRFVIR